MFSFSAFVKSNGKKIKGENLCGFGPFLLTNLKLRKNTKKLNYKKSTQNFKQTKTSVQNFKYSKI